jgi:hypothetical protein
VGSCTNLTTLVVHCSQQTPCATQEMVFGNQPNDIHQNETERDIQVMELRMDSFDSVPHVAETFLVLFGRPSRVLFHAQSRVHAVLCMQSCRVARSQLVSRLAMCSLNSLVLRHVAVQVFLGTINFTQVEALGVCTGALCPYNQCICDSVTSRTADLMGFR